MKKLIKFLVVFLFLLVAMPAFAATDINFSWDANPDIIIGYRVYVAPTPGGHVFGEANAVAVIPSGTEIVTILDVVDGLQYWVLTAYNAYGESSPSNELSILIDSSPPNSPMNFDFTIIIRFP